MNPTTKTNIPDIPSRKPVKIGKLLFLIAGEIALLLFLFLVTRFHDRGLQMNWFHNAVSEWVVAGSVFIALLVAGLFPDFLRSFVYMLKEKETITTIQVQKSLMAVKLAMAVAIVSNLFVLVFLFVSMAESFTIYADQLETLFPYSLEALGGNAIYGLLAVMLLLPVYARLKIRLLSME